MYQKIFFCFDDYIKIILRNITKHFAANVLSFGLFIGQYSF
ncbi:hypothetical protein GALL_47740 [mine drainage metagenome]|uniref:Uncharacterized protein n=1 Tax=mine drainage metagenome TaxID=410659 RepID=A0A1J5T2B9_9ZZZZ